MCVIMPLDKGVVKPQMKILSLFAHLISVWCIYED